MVKTRMGGTIGMLGLAAVLAGASIARAEFRVAVVDMQRALNECDAGKKARDQVKSKFEKAQDSLKREREDLDRRREDFDKKAIVLKEEERRNLEKDLETRALDFKRKYEDFQRDLKRTDNELTSSIVEGLYQTVQEYGSSKGYNLVLEASNGALLYSDKANDITDEIVKIYNASPKRGTGSSKSGKSDDQ